MTLVHRVLYPTPIDSLEEYVKVRGGGGSRRGARARRRGDHRRDRGVGSAGSRRRRIPDRPQVAHGPRQLLRLRAHVGRRQRGRGRAGHVQGPHDPAQRSVPGARGRADRGARGRRRSDHRRHEAVVPAEVERLRAAIGEIKAAGWCDGIEIDGLRRPERVPLRRGDRAAGDRSTGATRSRASRRRTGAASARSSRRPPTSTPSSGLSAHVEMAGPGADTEAPPALVDNVETLANVARIIARGADWFRTEGTDRVARHHRVHRHGLDRPPRRRRGHHGHPAARGHRRDRRRRRDPAGSIRAVLPGVSSAFITRRRARHARELRSAGRDRQRARLGRLHRVRRRRRSRRGRGRRLPVPRGRVVRAVHAVQARRAAHRRAARR